MNLLTFVPAPAMLLVCVLMTVPVRAHGQQPTTITPAPESPAGSEASPPPAQPSLVTRATSTLAQRNALQLQLDLEELARGAAMPTLVGAIGGLLLGGLTAGYGVAVAVSGDELGQTAGRAALSGVALSAGLVMMTHAVQSLLSGNGSDQLRLERWRRASVGGLPDATVVARFEGELAAEADSARAQRIASGVSNIGIALGGATLIAFGASHALQGHAQTAAYLFGGTMLGIGTLESLSLLLWSRSAHERVWQRHEAIKLANASPLRRVSLSPSFSRQSLALGVRATF
jgi:hypothetical protein